ncbi:response regulator [Hydrogenophaga sp.]|uniref:response regulator n=1 Tax=Hydrogenophaga sp. TaxID=1904254 RepID=UPI00271D042B|nr:response regulator [Hydrogenophaga sp.]MDO9436441.1 response regulator [Hydrogenophaga sp.]
MSCQRKPRVLCVDDEPGVLRMLRWLLEGQFDVTCTTDTREARMHLRSDDFEVVISDQRMPGMLGTEFLRWARIESPNTMRLMLSGYSDFTEIVDAVNASEVFRFLPKPWDEQQLLEAVDYAAAVVRRVPVRTAELSVESDEDDTIEPRDNEAILLLDPDPATEQHLREALGDATPLHWVRSIHEATAWIERHPASVLLVETEVGGDCTLDFIRAVKRRQPLAVTIATSGKRDGSNVVCLINDAQIFRFLKKPLVPSQTREMVRAALRQHRMLQAHPMRAARYKAQPDAGANPVFN